MIPTGLKRSLANKLWLGCANSVNTIKNVVPIDTQRLHETVSSTNTEIDGDVIRCRITVGGQNLYGLRREQNIKKDVNYAKIVEARTGFLRQSLSDITNIILNELK